MSLQDPIARLEELSKAFSAGVINGSPSSLVDGSAVQLPDNSTEMKNTCFQDKHIKLQKFLKVDPCKSTTVIFNREISYGSFEGKAVGEGMVGQEDDGSIVTVMVPMGYYTETRKASLQSDLVNTKDGVSGTERQADRAAKTIAGAVELACFRGFADFSNAGLFDGTVMPKMVGMHGLDIQVRQSDSERKSHDLMFAAYGSDSSVVIPVGGNFSQEKIEDAWTRAYLGLGEAERLIVDPIALSNYNKLAIAKERIVLGGSPQESLGSSLRKQHTSGGMVTFEPSHFLRGRTGPDPAVALSPIPPTSAVAATTTDTAAPTSFTVGQKYIYAVTCVNEAGESTKTYAAQETIGATADKILLTITHPSATVRYFRVYRTLSGGVAGTEKFVGNVKLRVGSSTTIFTDLNNKLPGSTNAYLIDESCMGLKEMQPYTNKKLSESSLFTVIAYFRFVTLAVYEPRKMVILDNVI